MAEYIEREAAIKTLRGKCVAKYPMSLSLGLFAAADEIESIPAADVVPVVHGRWRKAKTFDIDRAYECSICGDTPFYDEIEKFNYCRRCGARMDKDGDWKCMRNW